MSQTAAVLTPAAVDYERTLVLSIEVSNKNWVLAAQVPGLPHTKAKRTINPEDPESPEQCPVPTASAAGRGRRRCYGASGEATVMAPSSLHPTDGVPDATAERFE
jgi:hypothetical protein